MVFFPTPQLKKVELKLATLIETILPVSLEKEALDTFEEKSELPSSLENEKTNEAIIAFYLSVFELPQKIQAFKQTKTAHETSEIEKQKKVYEKIKDSIVSQGLQLVKEEPKGWTYICNTKLGRESLYYIACILMMYTHNLNASSFLETLLVSLETTSHDENEKHVLQYFQFQMMNQNPHFFIQTVSQITNPYIQAHIKLEAPHPFITAEEDSLLLSSLFEGFPIHSIDVPCFILTFLHIQLAYKGLRRLEQFSPSSALFIELFKKLQQSNLGIKSQPTGPNDKENILNYVHIILECIRVFHQQFAPYFNDELVLKKAYIRLMHTYLNLYVLTDGNVILSTTHLKLSQCATKLILSNQSSAFEGSEHAEQAFLDILSLLLNVANAPFVEMDFVHLFAQNINIYIENYIRLHRVKDATLILGSFLEYNSEFHLLTQAHVSFLQGLYCVFEIFTLLENNQGHWNSHPPEKLKALMKELTQDIKINKAFDASHKKLLKSQFSQVPSELKLILLRHINAFSEDKVHITKVIQTPEEIANFRQLMSDLARFLDINDKDLAPLKLVFTKTVDTEKLYHELLAEEDAQTPIKKGHKAGARAKSDFSKKSSPRKQAELKPSSVTMFQAAAPITRILKTEISPYLIKLATALKTQFGQDLILNGSAVTYLLLKKPHPHDHDCLILDCDLKELIPFLNRLGYSKCIVVGKEYPTLNFCLEDGTQIDLSTASTEKIKRLSFQDKMAKILSFRDFKLCALYLNLNEMGEYFEIKGFDHALRSVNQKLISIVESRIDVFEQDPIRLFRLAKINLQYPDFNIDGFLQGILNKTCTSTLFINYFSEIAKGELHQRKVGTQIEELFKRFGIRATLEIMDKMGLLKAFSGFDLKTLSPNLDVLLTYIEHMIAHPGGKLSKAMTIEDYKKYVPKLAFYQYLLIHMHTSPLKEMTLETWVFKTALTRVRDSDLDSYKFINAQFNAPDNEYKEFPGPLYQMILELQKASPVLEGTPSP